MGGEYGLTDLSLILQVVTSTLTTMDMDGPPWSPGEVAAGDGACGGGAQESEERGLLPPSWRPPSEMGFSSSSPAPGVTQPGMPPLDMTRWWPGKPGCRMVLR